VLVLNREMEFIGDTGEWLRRRGGVEG